MRQTPAYEVTTPTYSVTPPALEFEPTPAELKLKGKHSKTYSNPQHTRFKISVDNDDVNNFQPTPPPTTRAPTTKKKKTYQQPKRPKPTPPAQLNVRASSSKGGNRQQQQANRAKKVKEQNYTAPNRSKEPATLRDGADDDLITNEIESESLQKNKVQLVSTSIYDPRPKSRPYKKSYSSNKRDRGRSSRLYKKYNYRSKKKKNYNLPIRESKIQSKKSVKSPRKKFVSDVEGYKPADKKYETVKRDQKQVRLGQAPQPIFLSPARAIVPSPPPPPPPPPSPGAPLPPTPPPTAPSPAHIKSLLPLRTKPTFVPNHSEPAAPFTAFHPHPTPSLAPLLQPGPSVVPLVQAQGILDTTIAPPVTHPPPTPLPPVAQFSQPVQHFASFAPVHHLPHHPKPHPSPPPPPPPPLLPPSAPLPPAIHHSEPFEPHLEDPSAYEVS